MALPKLGRNDPCWCGSGIKYKRCHLGRERQPPLPVSDVLTTVRNAQERRACLHPAASSETCKGAIIKAHTVPRASLQKIARTGHVYQIVGDLPTLMKTKGLLVPKLVGINKASTFTGFCGHHDHTTFEPFEAGTYTSLEQASFLLAYRALCLELFNKAGVASLEEFSRQLDRGHGSFDQLAIQLFERAHHNANAVGLRDLQEEKRTYDDALGKSDFSGVNYLLFQLDNPPGIMCSGGHFPQFDFEGSKLQDLGDPAMKADALTFSALAEKEGGWLLFSWYGNGNSSEAFTRSLLRLEKSALPDAILRFIFETNSNTYISPAWWESLTEEQRTYMVSRLQKASDLFDERGPDYLRDDGFRAAPWAIKEACTNVASLQKHLTPGLQRTESA